MTASLPPYPAYKETGIPWLPRIPAHWELRRGKMLFDVIDARSETGTEELLTVSAEHGVIPRRNANVTMFKAESYVGYKLCWPGDLVINSLWAWARGLGVSRYHGIVSSAYSVYRPKAFVNGKYIHNLARSSPFQWELQVRSKGIWVSRLQLTDEAFLNAPFPLPPLPEQHAIARYLDWADARITRLIRLRERQVKLLEEYKQALIHQAVTGQIDVRTGKPYPEYKDSGIPWLGKVPKHWEVQRLRTLVELRVSNVDKRSSESEIPVRLCNYVDVYKNEYIFSDLPFMRATATETEIERFRLQAGDVLITKDSEVWNDIGVPALVVESADDLISGYHLALLRPYWHLISGEYLFRALQSKRVVSQLHISANGVTRFGLSHNAIKSVWIPVPPLSEQAFIEKFLNRQTTKIYSAIDVIRRSIELLREYRTRLIADVVTGQVDVRTIAARLPSPEEEENALIAE